VVRDSDYRYAPAWMVVWSNEYQCKGKAKTLSLSERISSHLISSHPLSGSEVRHLAFALIPLCGCDRVDAEMERSFD
jgi:hypothetical protein